MEHACFASINKNKHEILFFPVWYAFDWKLQRIVFLLEKERIPLESAVPAVDAELSWLVSFFAAFEETQVNSHVGYQYTTQIDPEKIAFVLMIDLIGLLWIKSQNNKLLNQRVGSWMLPVLFWRSSIFSRSPFKGLSSNRWQKVA